MFWDFVSLLNHDNFWRFGLKVNEISVLQCFINQTYIGMSSNMGMLVIKIVSVQTLDFGKYFMEEMIWFYMKLTII